ncbi:cannabinoid receptor 2 [Ambystoma mexicanum]|uniref:cannabinoid receptor 2 n=1 Tax=Ambystoma mexicanum TaxID=8296 RepID=UPI0037E7CD1E
MGRCGVHNATGCGAGFQDLECYMVLNNTFQKSALAALSCTVGALCILENAVVLCIIISSLRLRGRPSYLFLGSVALADFLASIIFTYSFVDFHVFKGTSSRGLFLWKLGGVIACFTASLGSLLLTAFDRYICIHRPSVYKAIVTRKRALVSLAGTWVITLVIAYLPWMGWDCCQRNAFCSELFPLIDNRYLTCWLCIVLVLLIAIIYSYSHILWKAHKHVCHMEQWRQQAAQAHGQPNMRMDILLAKTLALLLSVILLCWSPVLLLMMYSLLHNLTGDIKRAFAFCCNLCLLNCMVNPLVYALRSRDMRLRLKKGLIWFGGLLRLPGQSQEAGCGQLNSARNIVSEEALDDTDS